MDDGLAERAESMFVRSGKHVLHRLLTRVTSMQGGGGGHEGCVCSSRTCRPVPARMCFVFFGLHEKNYSN